MARLKRPLRLEKWNYLHYIVSEESLGSAESEKH
jgi:hypothetical protein